ncbi:[Pyruvate dehydrogenase [acetyl-transferring]]-phosphatase 1, mitochondrial Short=PDP 1; AltName: Full=Phosphatase two C protein 5; AltName: Full=Protein phosphatase 2C homolog 5; Short=PP2C-5; AltName: Full=Protein phosphatase of PDH protein 1; AltName: Full=Pyruvate dehydrogenase complex phosphatase 1; Short=PDC phosphatase 1; Flags: Precursor [Serendipita indica DSM 11827]|nr:[Pyruvate dehydrogenase [acetyl-transferring]]-phosphatase 1, mitochondrial Short=PDP 1; AltName: Full=Phosphatase two C protein 5; AltName: Full=Protein phosphatase 2C homolog 5; Short=PP2C-5; AltName: Full=Protein phosphatase of PDH protein 1; AltName: Full=Pyruvate dehydrogenase complex phosphatase 1; Short=PDC phosphatase 1; Flags: Precursor [Serendipita indica DSM 11827]
MEVPYLPNATVEERVKVFSRTLFSPPPQLYDSDLSRDCIKFFGAQLNSNEPVEDMQPEAVVYTYKNSTRKPLIVTAIADGHSGPYTSAKLSGNLGLLTVLTLAREQGFKVDVPKVDITEANIELPSAFKLHKEKTAGLLQKAWEAYDAYLVFHEPKQAAKTMSVDPQASQSDQQALVLPGYSGACALAAFVDTEEKEMWVACTGDCRAVAGYWDEKGDGTGTWRVDVLSEDQTAESPKEVARIIREHPKDNAGNVIRNGRILGSLQPSRSFGDLRYKWPAQMQQELLPKLLPPNVPVRPPPANLLTPPYVTARPEVQYRKFTLPSSAPSSNSPRSTLRFLILATDGLWDELSNTDAVALVAGHQSGYRGSIPRGELTKRIPTTEDISNKTSDPLPHAAKSNKGSYDWSFRDEHVGMHLIRNAIGGQDDQKIQQLLSIPPPYSRRFRDDISVAIITFDKDDMPVQEVTRSKL